MFVLVLHSYIVFGSSSMESTKYGAMDSKICFICNCVSRNYNKNLFEIKSKYSDTRLSDFIVKILGDFPFKREYSIECAENLVCNNCLNKVNEYDLACLTAKRVENELRELLVRQTALSLAIENDAPIEPVHQLFTESTETTELMNNIKIEELNCSDLEPMDAFDKEPDDKVEVEHYVPPSTFRQVRKISAELRDEPEFVQSRNLRYRKTRVVQRKKTTVKTNVSSFNKNSVYEQQIKHHKDEEDQLKCQYCALELLNETALADHRELHENSSSPFQCVLCEKIFKAKAALVRHMRIHSGLKFYQCERCGKEFIHKSSFQMHILSHDDIRKKKCSYLGCEMHFRSSSHLNRHLRTHTGAKPWSCEICNQRFAQRYNMTVHRRLHDSNSEKDQRTKNHLCNFCGSTFARKSKLEEHLQKSHEAVIPHTAIGKNLSEKRSHTQETKAVN